MKSFKSQATSLNNPPISCLRFGFRGFTYRSYRSYKFAFPGSPPSHRRARAILLFSFIFPLLSFTAGCATETIAQGITTKNVSGNGTVIESHVGINTDTKIPELKTLFISGDIATVKAGTNQISYREECSSSVWNASSVTKKRFLAITLTDAGDVPAAIKAVAEVIKEAEADAKKEDVRTAQ